MEDNKNNNKHIPAFIYECGNCSKFKQMENDKKASIEHTLLNYSNNFKNDDIYSDIAFLNDRPENVYNTYRVAMMIFLNPRIIKMVPCSFYFRFLYKFIYIKIKKMFNFFI